MPAAAAQLDSTKRSPELQDFESCLRRKIIGQEEAIQAVVDFYQLFHARLHPPRHPIGNLLFLGPTGTGKTRVCEATAEILVGDPRAVIKVDCGEFQHSHEIAKLCGSPPGYLGHRETNPMITQQVLEKYHTDTIKISFILFDEIEKASDALWQLLLGVLDKAVLTLGDNRTVDFTQTLIFLTSNLGGADITTLMTGGLGFAPIAEDKPELDEKIGRTAEEAAKRKFTPEFMNRLDRVVVFHPLRPEQLVKILDLELENVQKRIMDSDGKFVFRLTPATKEFLLSEGTDIKYGARYLKRAIEKHLVYPLARLVDTHQINIENTLLVDSTGNGLIFIKE